MAKFVGLILIIALLSVNCDAFWSACPSITPPRAVRSAACTATICNVPRGQTSNFVATVVFNRSHAHLLTRLTIFVGGVGVVIPQAPPHNNACNFLTPGGCPTIPNTEYTYNLALPVSAAAPIGNTIARFEFLENGVVELCADINVRIG